MSTSSEAGTAAIADQAPTIKPVTDSVDENYPLVSVVVATRDRPEMLRTAIDAITVSDYAGPIETIVVFDQSEPDETLADDDGHRPVRVIRNTRTLGLAGARNSGVLAATGRWLALCDDDDEWFPTKLRRQVDRLNEQPAARLATCGISVHFDGDDFVRIPVEDRLTFDAFLDDRMTEVHPSSFVMDRIWFIEEVGLVDEELPGSYAEDYDVLLRASRCSQIVSAGEPLVRINWHPSTYFRDRWKMIDEALGFLVDKHPEFQQAPAGLARIRGQQAFAAAAAGERRRALSLVKETMALRPTEKRSILALAVAGGVPADFLLRLAHRFGRGI